MVVVEEEFTNLRNIHVHSKHLKCTFFENEQLLKSSPKEDFIMRQQFMQPTISDEGILPFVGWQLGVHSNVLFIITCLANLPKDHFGFWKRGEC